MRAILSTLTLGGLLRGRRRTRNIYTSWSGLMGRANAICEYVMGRANAICDVVNMSTGTPARRRCRRFDSQKCVCFLWWRKCLCAQPVYGRWCAHSIVNLHPVRQRHWRVQTVLENWSKAHLETIFFLSTFSLKFPYCFVYTISLTFLFSFLFCCITCSACVWIIIYWQWRPEGPLVIATKWMNINRLCRFKGGLSLDS